MWACSYSNVMPRIRFGTVVPSCSHHACPMMGLPTLRHAVSRSAVLCRTMASVLTTTSASSAVLLRGGSRSSGHTARTH